MPVRRIFTAFDWSRYNALGPPLQHAVESASFDELSEEDALEGIELEDALPVEIANAALVNACTGDDAVPFEHGLPELVSWLRRQPCGQEPAELLGYLISAGPNVEPWYKCDVGLAGMLAVDQTVELAQGFAQFRRTGELPKPPRGISALARRFTPVDVPHARLSDLMLLVDETAARNQGLAVIAEE